MSSSSPARPPATPPEKPCTDNSDLVLREDALSEDTKQAMFARACAGFRSKTTSLEAPDKCGATRCRSVVSKLGLRRLFQICFLVSVLFAGIGSWGADALEQIPPLSRNDSALVAHLSKLAARRVDEGPPPFDADVFAFVANEGASSYRDFLVSDGFVCSDMQCFYAQLAFVEDSLVGYDRFFSIRVWLIQIESDSVKDESDVKVTKVDFLHKRAEDE